MQRFKQYTNTDRMSDLVSDNYRILLIMSRFGIHLGFGDKSIDEVCTDNKVDTNTFLAIANMSLDGDPVLPSYKDISIASLLNYLHNSHDYFLGFRLPGIRNDLKEVVGESDELSKAVIRYFDEYVEEVSNHMKYEEETVFPYVRSLLSGEYDKKYNIGIFRKRHDQVEARLKEFKQILIKYYPAKSTNRINSILFDIFNCEYDLASHNAVEDRLFIPAILELEQKSGKKS